MKKKSALFLVLFLNQLQAVTVGLVGGGRQAPSNTSYAALVALDGTLTRLSGGGIPPIGVIKSVGLNGSGHGIIGGRDLTGDGLFYAAFVSPEGTLTQIPIFSGSSSEITSVAINASGAAILGGFDGTVGYAVLVAPDGTLTELSGGSKFPPDMGNIFSVGINASGIGIIGGSSMGPQAYAALVAPNGILTELSGGGFPSIGGDILSVAINHSGIGLIGGDSTSDSGPAYAALVAPDGTLTQLSGGGFPSVTGIIDSVAINESGVGIIGGFDGTGTQPAYAALMAPDGTLKQLLGGKFPSISGNILTVAINASGVGLIGGESFLGLQPAYAALVAPDGTLIDLSGAGLPKSGSIDSVAISDAGIGLIGGEDFTSPDPAYLALVAPNGTLTQLSGVGFPSVNGFIDSVATFLAPPSTIGPYSSALNIQLAASYGLSSHLGMRTCEKILFSQQETCPPTPISDSLIHPEIETPEPAEPPSCDWQPTNYEIWMEPFGNYLYQKGSGPIPAFSNKIAGTLAGFDYHTGSFLVGGALGYGYNSIHYGQSLGRGQIREELACVYTSYVRPYFYFNAVLWGGLYQVKNVRHSLFGLITSRAHTRGWLFTPHVEIASPIALSNHPWCIFQPFVMLDWTKSWQKRFSEHGSSGFNLVIKRQYNELVRSEGGLRIYQDFARRFGQIILEEKISYVNQMILRTKRVESFFIGSISTFPVAVNSLKPQNLVGTEFRVGFFSYSQRKPYAILDFCGEFGSSYQSYFTSVELGFDF